MVTSKVERTRRETNFRLKNTMRHGSTLPCVLKPFAEISRATVLISPILGGGGKCPVTHFFTCLVWKRSHFMLEKRTFGRELMLSQNWNSRLLTLLMWSHFIIKRYKITWCNIQQGSNLPKIRFMERISEVVWKYVGTSKSFLTFFACRVLVSVRLLKLGSTIHHILIVWPWLWLVPILSVWVAIEW